MMAFAALSNCTVSCRLGHVAVVLGKLVDGNGVQGVLELLLLLLCSDMLDTCKERKRIRTLIIFLEFFITDSLYFFFFRDFSKSNK